MAVFKCKRCGGALDIEPGASIGTCQYCGTQQTLPNSDDDKRANLYDRANHFRRNNEYDKAAAIYEMILNEDPTDAEVYWSLVLCKYGVEYVKDPQSGKYIPTCNRAQLVSVLADADYKQAIAKGDAEQRYLYEQEAREIDAIQKGILEISGREEPFDVFICYKEADERGRRTPDSVLAQDLYYQLTNEGLKVFFARISLEDKLGAGYEPYIFAALQSAKVMVVLGTKAEHFNAVWVKNEWARYTALIKDGAKKSLIPAYRDMDPYDLPDEFSHLQAQDMGKLGFMQDLIRGIRKLTDVEKPGSGEPVAAGATGAAAGGAEPLVRRAFIFLEDGDFDKAHDLLDQALNLDPENAKAYTGLLCCERLVRNEEALADDEMPLGDSGNFKKALRFADEAYASVLNGYEKTITERLERERLELERKAAEEQAEKERLAAEEERLAAEELAEKERRAAEERIKLYKEADLAFNRKKYGRALSLFANLGDFSDAKERAKATRRLARKRVVKRVIKCALVLIVLVLAYPKIAEQCLFFYGYTQFIPNIGTSNYNNSVHAYSIPSGYDISIRVNKRLRKNAEKYTQDAFDRFKNIEELHFDSDWSGPHYIGDRMVGLKRNGRVIAIGLNDKRQNNVVSGWRNIVEIYADSGRTVGLKKDGSVVAVGNNRDGQNNVSGWRNIVEICANFERTVGLKKDGSVVAVGDNQYGQNNVSDWRDIVKIYADYRRTIGLKKDGSVVAVGESLYGENDVSEWRDIAEIYLNSFITVGLKKDGSVVAVGRGASDVPEWRDIAEICYADESGVIIGLKKDGNIVAVGDHDISGWQDIAKIYVYEYGTAGLKKDGSVVATGWYKKKVSGWRNITEIYLLRDRAFGVTEGGSLVYTALMD
jgi:tetratricopeptide (TPR) repeat protein